MRKIVKYEIAPGKRVPMPKGASILSVGEVGMKICLWAAVDPEAPIEEYDIRILGDDDELPESMWAPRFLGTIQVDTLGLALVGSFGKVACHLFHFR